MGYKNKNFALFRPYKTDQYAYKNRQLTQISRSAGKPHVRKLTKRCFTYVSRPVFYESND